MNRTLRSKRLRALLWYAADGTCQICGQPLGDDWEADHIVPWSLSRRTNVHEMQAVCAACNRRKGTRMLRKHQLEFDRVCRDILHGTQIRAIILSVTPGGGKSLIPQILAKHLVGPFVDHLCWIVPRSALRDQGEGDFTEAHYRTLIGHTLEIRQSTNDTNPSRGKAGFVTTYQAVVQNPDLYVQEFNRAPKGYALILDEPHHLVEGESWHRAIDPLYRAAKLVVLMSGTWDKDKKIAYIPYRSMPDGTQIPDIPKTSVLKGTTQYIHYNRIQAIQERAIKPLRPQPHDGYTQYIDRKGQAKFQFSLAESTGQDTTDGLFTALNTEFADQILDRMVVDYQAYRVHYPWAKAIVISPSIQRAREHLKYIRAGHPGVRAEIAVSKDEDGKDSSDASDMIARFKLDHTKPTAVDILITVAMAYEGLDVPGITHLAYVSLIRSKPWIEQALARAARVYKNAPYEEQSGRIYCPDDRLLQQVIDEIVAEQDRGFREQQTICDINPSDRQPPASVIPEQSGITRHRALDMADGLSIDYARTAQWRAVAQKLGVRHVDPITLERMYLEMQSQPAPSDIAPTPAPMTPSARESKLLQTIERRARSIDYQHRRKFGTTNDIIKRKFGKSREDMTEQELTEVWKWINEQYPTQ